MAELLACVLTAFQLAATDLQADVLCFEIVVVVVAVGTLFLLLFPFGGPLLSRAACRSAFVAAAVALGPADTGTLRLLLSSLVADYLLGCSPAPAGNVNYLLTVWAAPVVAFLRA